MYGDEKDHEFTTQLLQEIHHKRTIEEEVKV